MYQAICSSHLYKFDAFHAGVSKVLAARRKAAVPVFRHVSTAYDEAKLRTLWSPRPERVRLTSTQSDFHAEASLFVSPVGPTLFAINDEGAVEDLHKLLGCPEKKTFLTTCSQSFLEHQKGVECSPIVQ